MVTLHMKVNNIQKLKNVILFAKFVIVKIKIIIFYV